MQHAINIPRQTKYENPKNQPRNKMTLTEIYEEYSTGSEGFCIAVNTHCGYQLTIDEIERIALQASTPARFNYVFETLDWWRDGNSEPEDRPMFDLYRHTFDLSMIPFDAIQIMRANALTTKAKCSGRKKSERNEALAEFYLNYLNRNDVKIDTSIVGVFNGRGSY